jgi:sulfur carrier protein
MSVLLNGTPAPHLIGRTIDEAVTTEGLPRRGVAVAVNGAVIPKSAWSTTRLEAEDQVEVVTAAAGG